MKKRNGKEAACLWLWFWLLLAGGITPLFAQYPSSSSLIPSAPTAVRPGQCAPASKPAKADFCIGCYDASNGNWLDCETQFASYFDSPSPDNLYWTGGHSHSDSARPVGQMTCDAMDTHDGAYTQFSGYTRDNEWPVIKTMPEVSGIITVFASYVAPWNYYCMPSGIFTCDPNDLRVARGYFGFDVGSGGFAELPSWPEVYVRCGITAGCLCDNVSPNHPSAFLGTPEMIAAVEDLAVRFQAAYPNLRLRITDMSLPRGGLFDINENWVTPHCRHRTGTSVDVSKYALTVTNPRTVPINVQALVRLAKNCGMGRVPEGPIHFELGYGS